MRGVVQSALNVFGLNRKSTEETLEVELIYSVGMISRVLSNLKHHLIIKNLKKSVVFVFFY